MRKAKIYYARMDEFWRKEQKLSCLEKFESLQDVDWQEIQPDKKNNWLENQLEEEIQCFIPIGIKSKSSKDSNFEKRIFEFFGHGIKTGRDSIVYSFNKELLYSSIKSFSQYYNIELLRYRQSSCPENIDDFLNYKSIKWSRNLKRHLVNLEEIEPCKSSIRSSLYRPFVRNSLYFDRLLIDELGSMTILLPLSSTEKENILLCIPNVGGRTSYWCFSTCLIPDTALTSLDMTQCLPFYIYDKNGTNRRENITDWALEQFQIHYQDPKITKWDIFHYTYAVLHHPHYRQRYAANLKRELPRIPFAPEFQPFATAGKRLAEIHINYEQQPEYRLKHIENKDIPIDWRVEKMRLSKDKTQIKYNDFLTLAGIPPETFAYKLGNRSALDWIIDQYRVSTDKRSGITNDPNRLDDEEYIVRLIKQIITVSLETVKIVEGLPDLGLPND